MIFCILILILIYWKASSFLQNQEGGYEDDIASEALEEKEQLDMPTSTSTPVTYARLKSFASMEEAKPLLEAEHEDSTELIEHCTFLLRLQLSQEKNCLTGQLENLHGLGDLKSRSINTFRFHLTLLPSKRFKFRSGYRSFKQLSTIVNFSFANINIENLKGSTLRLRLYGRRFEFGVPVNNAKCLGESYIKLDKYISNFENHEEVKSKQAILPKSEQFPSADDGLFDAAD